jgi:AraC-like DNA-binding protein
LHANEEPFVRFARPEDLRSIPSATGGIARLACARMREAGKPVATVLSGAGVTAAQIDDPGLRLLVQTQIRLLDLAARELQDEYLGFHLARSFDLREIGLLYYVMASSERLEEALRNAERYSGINNEGVHLRFSPERATVIRLDYHNVDRLPDRHQIEFWLITVVRLCRQLTDNRLAPRKLMVRHVRNGTPAEYRSFLGSDVQFGADVDEIVFAAQAAALPLVSADNYLNRLLRRYADEALHDRPQPRIGARAQVERLLPQLLPHGKATTSEVARRLGVSRRTLSRSLAAEGVSFARILEDLRATLARRYLKEHELPVTEIAWLLGYREIGSFTHAFRRWTGMSPSQFRFPDRFRRNDRGNRLPARKRS